MSAAGLDYDLSGVELLADLSPAEWSKIDALCTWQDVPSGDHVFRRGEKSDSFYFLVKGKLRAISYRSGEQEVAFADVTRGGSFGELSAIDGEARSADMVAVEDSVVGAITRQQFRDLLARHPSVALRMLSLFTRVVRQANDRVVDLSTRSPVQRVYSELLRESQPDPSGSGAWMIDPMPRHEEIASWAGTTTETVARAVGQLMKLGMVKRQGKARQGKALFLIDRTHIQKLATVS
ncbi:MAG: Crp/Fnr family transcriptional regulator [Alphaproteobacteria bacterium]|nr:Crp/Fnr family transcriptional regulator [Alphaproteobacteria bacterium]